MGIFGKVHGLWQFSRNIALSEAARFQGLSDFVAPDSPKALFQRRTRKPHAESSWVCAHDGEVMMTEAENSRSRTPFFEQSSFIPLCVDPLPGSSAFWLLADFLSEDCWRKISAKTIECAGGSCQLCGVFSELSCVEVWRFEGAAENAPDPCWGVQRLERLMAVCQDCRGIFELNWIISDRQRDDGFERLRVLNGWSIAEVMEFRDWWEKECVLRDRRRWALDLSALDGCLPVQPDLFVRDDGAIFKKWGGGKWSWTIATWIHGGVVAPHRDHVAPSSEEIAIINATPLIKNESMTSVALHQDLRS